MYKNIVGTILLLEALCASHIPRDDAPAHAMPAGVGLRGGSHAATFSPAVGEELLANPRPPLHVLQQFRLHSGGTADSQGASVIGMRSAVSVTEAQLSQSADPIWGEPLLAVPYLAEPGRYFFARFPRGRSGVERRLRDERRTHFLASAAQMSAQSSPPAPVAGDAPVPAAAAAAVVASVSAAGDDDSTHAQSPESKRMKPSDAVTEPAGVHPSRAFSMRVNEKIIDAITRDDCCRLRNICRKLEKTANFFHMIFLSSVQTHIPLAVAFRRLSAATDDAGRAKARATFMTLLDVYNHHRRFPSTLVLGRGEVLHYAIVHCDIILLSSLLKSGFSLRCLNSKVYKLALAWVALREGSEEVVATIVPYFDKHLIRAIPRNDEVKLLGYLFANMKVSLPLKMRTVQRLNECGFLLQLSGNIFKGAIAKMSAEQANETIRRLLLMGASTDKVTGCMANCIAHTLRAFSVQDHAQRLSHMAPVSAVVASTAAAAVGARVVPLQRAAFPHEHAPHTPALAITEGIEDDSDDDDDFLPGEER